VVRFEWQWTTRRKKIAIGAACAVAVMLGAGLAFGPIVRSRADKEAARRGVVLDVGRVRPGWFSVALEDVTVAPEGTKGVRAHIGQVTLDLGVTMSLQGIHASDVRVELEDDALAEIAAWRERHPAKGEGGAKTPVDVERAAIAWKKAFGDADASLDATGIALKRDEKGTHVSSENLTIVRKRATVTLGSTTGELEGGKLHEAHVDFARLALELADNDVAPAAAASTAPEPPPPVQQNGHKKNGKAASPEEPFHPIVEMPNLHAFRAIIQNLGQRVADRAPEGLHVSLDALTVELSRGKEKLELGPGKVTVERHAQEVALEFSAGTGQTPLTLHASLPLAAGDTTVALAGGPVTLSMLGVREGAFGFADPARANVTGKARVSLDDAAKALTFDADVAASGVSIRNAKLADDTVRGLDVRVSARGVLDDAGAVRLDDAEAQLGALHVRAHGGIEQTSDHLSAALSLELPVAGCQSLLESIPAALFPHISQARFRGTLGAKGYLAFDTRKIDDLVLKYDIDDLCRVMQAPEELRKDHFDGSFTYAIVDKDRQPAERETGPGTPDWAPLDTISPMMQVAVLTTEDGAFFHHHGFNEWAIKSSLIANIKAGRFVRGASTITMQLAKNLFLSREKTLSRKLEELILADYLERTFKKDELMELYFNIVEFGPDIYGVKAAAEHYFGRRPAELNLAECLFLSSLLPNPRGYHKIYEKGELPQSWINNIHQLMEIAHKNARISDKELEEAKTQTIVFHKEDAPLPVPRQAVTGSHFTGDDVWETN
jgi:hypothetical protein